MADIFPVFVGYMSNPLNWVLIFAPISAISLILVDWLYLTLKLRRSKQYSQQLSLPVATKASHVSPTSEAPSAELTRGERFLLTDFEYVRAFKEQSVTIADKRIDIYVALATAVGGGLAFLVHSMSDTRLILMVTAISSAALLTIGISTFLLVLDRDILIVDYIRASNRIRGYFAERDPEIQDYLLMPVDEMYPRYGWQSSSRPIPVIFNALCFGVLATSISLLERGIMAIDSQAIAVCGIYFVLTWALQWVYAKLRCDQAEAKARVARSVSLYASHERFRSPATAEDRVNTPVTQPIHSTPVDSRDEPK